MRCGDDSQVAKLQFATDGAWEHALILRAGEAEAAARFVRWLPATEREYAVEAFFDAPQPTGAVACFWGVRFAHPSRAVTDAMREMTDALASGEYPLRDARRTLERAAGGAFFASSPAFGELGQLNNWAPFGPLRFFSRGDAPVSAVCDALAAALAANPRFLAPTELPVALEIAWTHPVPHWFGFVVSETREDGLFAANAQAAARTLSALYPR